MGRQGPEAQGGSEGWESWGPGVVTGLKRGPGPGLLGSSPLAPHTSCPLSRGLASFPATTGASLMTVFVSSPPPMPTAPIPEEAQEEGKWVQDPSPYPAPLALVPLPPKDMQCALDLTSPLSSCCLYTWRPSSYRSPQRRYEDTGLLVPMWGSGPGWNPRRVGERAGRSGVPASKGLPHVALTAPTNRGQCLTRAGVGWRVPEGHAWTLDSGWAADGAHAPAQGPLLVVGGPGLTVPEPLPPAQGG